MTSIEVLAYGNSITKRTNYILLSTNIKKIKLLKIQLRPYTTVKLMLKALKNVGGPSFRRSTASSGIRKNILLGA